MSIETIRLLGEYTGEYCSICGGASTCPAGQEIVLLPDGAPVISHACPGPGWEESHRKPSTGSYWIPEACTVVGQAQSWRVLAHSPVPLERVWVGQCSYAFRRSPEHSA